MKRIKSLLIIVGLIVFFPSVVNAASANISVTGSSSAVVGNKITLTVKLSSNTPIGSWQMLLDYNSSYLQFVGGGGEAGGMNMANSSSGTKSQTYTFTFKALKSGNTTVKVNSYLVYAYSDMSEMSVSSVGKSIKIMTQAELEASYSKDNNLKALSVEGYEISPIFNKDTLEYTVNVPEGTTSINIVATKNDNTATITGDGVKEVSMGTNAFEIVVKAQNGAEKVYKLTVNVIDENPIEVKINDKKYTLIKYSAGVTCPSGYETTTKMIENIEIPACYNQTIKYTLVGLKDSEGHIVLARYKNNNYELYSELSSNTLIIIPQKSTKDFKNYEKMNIKINDQDVEVYKLNKDSKFSIVYGLNIATGKKDYYVYDEENKTFVLYDDEYINELEDLNEYYLIACIFFGSGLFLLTIGIIFSNNKNKKKKVSKNKKEEIEENVVETNIINSNSKNEKKSKKDKNEIVEVEENPDNIIEETEVYDIFEDTKKKKGKKK